ncbi:MAG: 3-phosphoshikimate 1-carboxyvinyltransferase [Candidatus Zixiibacteriota bacterium]
MKRDLKPARKVSGVMRVPGDKSIAHRAALISIIAGGQITVRNFPDNADCNSSLGAAQALGVTVANDENGTITLTPPTRLSVPRDTVIDCGNSGTTARLLAGLVAGTNQRAILSGDESLSRRPMARIVEPLCAMGAEITATDGHLPLMVQGRPLLPFEYRLPVASAQVKSALLLAGVAAGCSVALQEDVVTRDHTELMLSYLGTRIEVREISPVLQPDPVDPRKKRRIMPEDFQREIRLASRTRPGGGELDIPGDISTASFFFAAAALTGGTITVEQVGLNPTRTAFLEHLKNIGVQVSIANRSVVCGEPRGDVTVTGAELKGRKVSGEDTAAMIDEIPIIAVLAAFSKGETIVRDAAELRVKESDRIEAIAWNLRQMGVPCGVLEDGLIIDGRKDPSGGDFKAFGDHRIAMAFSIAALGAVGPSTLDDPVSVNISCPAFFELLARVVR